MNNLATTQNSAIRQIQDLSFSEAEIQILKSTILDAQTTNEELLLFGMICQQTGLSPFAKQIYGIRRKGKLAFQCAIDGYRLIADRTGQYAGNDDPLFDEGLTLYQHLKSGRANPTTATVTVWKVVGGVRCDFTASASWQQYVQLFNGKPSDTWQKMPHLMLSKCAESLALRKAFPNELSALRTSEEMEQEQLNIQRPTTSQLPPTQTEEKLKLAAKIKQLKLSREHLEKILATNFPLKFSIDDLAPQEITALHLHLDNFQATTTLMGELHMSPEAGQKILLENFGKDRRWLLSLSELHDFRAVLQVIADGEDD